MAVLGEKESHTICPNFNGTSVSNQSRRISTTSSTIPLLSLYDSSDKMSTSSPDSEELGDPLSDELRNIQSVIHVTRENIDALNEKFANLQEPPPMYVTEYQELTSKLHELEIKEHELIEKIQQQNETIEQPEEPTEVRFQFSFKNLVSL